MTSSSYPILSNITARIEFTMQNPEWYMQDFAADADVKKFRLAVSGAELIVPVRSMNLGLYTDLEVKLAKEPILYPLKRIQINKFVIPKGTQSWIIHTINSSSINPDRIAFFFMPGNKFSLLVNAHLSKANMLFIPEKTFEGTYKTSPFAFRSIFGTSELNKITLTVDGISVEQNDPVGAQEMKMAAYYQLHKHLGCLFAQNMGPAISYERFFSDGFIKMFDLTKSGRAWASQASRQPVKNGHLKLELGFTSNITEPLLVFAVSEFHSSFTINKNKVVKYNFVA